MYNIVFLDIDGVLNRYGGLQLLGWKIACLFKLQDWYRKHTKHPFEVRERFVKRLAKIIKPTNSKVVLTASCRGGYCGVKYEDKSENMKVLEDLFNKYNIEVIGRTSSNFKGHRGKQISEWLVQNKHLWKRYVIIDDETFDLNWYTRHRVVKVNGKTGLTNFNVQEALVILGY